MKRIRGGLGMAVTWALGWAIAGVLIGVSSNIFPSLPWDAFFKVFDAPLTMLAVPGFVAGALFSVVMTIAGRRRRLDELSVMRVAAWGAAGGLLLSLVPSALVATSLATGDGVHSLWQITAAITGPFVLLSAASAAVSLLLARRAQARHVDGSTEYQDSIGIQPSPRHEPLPGTPLPRPADLFDKSAKQHTRERR